MSLYVDVGLQDLAPTSEDVIFSAWGVNSGGSATKKGLNFLIALGAWIIWKHRNDCFSGASPSVQPVYAW
uniref:Uncharacterized protein n=1 Tax=Setaria italica TaxID=4555 RepID=K4A1A3_SETIT